jgi:hypothetical protein
LANRRPEHQVRDEHSTLDEEHMGSTPYGNASPMTLVRLALPQDMKIGRDGSGRVGVGGRT